MHRLVNNRMTLRRVRLTSRNIILLIFLLAMNGGAIYAESPHLAIYRVTIQNLTRGQPFSPPVAATHQNGVHMFEVGKVASDELAAIAQDGNEVPMFNLFKRSSKTTNVVDVGKPLTPAGKTIGMFTDSVTFEIKAAPGDRFSFATMLICTNDGFLGLNAVTLPHRGSLVHYLKGYDAGRENNTELSRDIVDPCSALGPFPLAGDPNGNSDAAVATIPPQLIQLHPGIRGVGDLSTAHHGWVDPVAKVTITRID